MPKEIGQRKSMAVPYLPALLQKATMPSNDWTMTVWLVYLY